MLEDQAKTAHFNTKFPRKVYIINMWFYLDCVYILLSYNISLFHSSLFDFNIKFFVPHKKSLEISSGTLAKIENITNLNHFSWGVTRRTSCQEN
jgi:hypothetical protein